MMKEWDALSYREVYVGMGYRYYPDRQDRSTVDEMMKKEVAEKTFQNNKHDSELQEVEGIEGIYVYTATTSVPPFTQ